jgi:hypothetical protein
MPCLNPDGTLTQTARALLAALETTAGAAPALATHTGFPLWRVRSSLRELCGHDLVEVAMTGAENNDALHRLTATGREVLDLSRRLDG